MGTGVNAMPWQRLALELSRLVAKGGAAPTKLWRLHGNYEPQTGRN